MANHHAPTMEELSDQIKKIAEGQDIELYQDPEVYGAYGYNNSLDPADLADWKDEAEEAYQGDYHSDAEFAEQFAEDIGETTGSGWPYSYIDWDSAARDLMMDYFEAGGHYFRNL